MTASGFQPSRFHLFRTVVWLIPVIAIYTIVLGTLSIASSLFERRGRLAHGCAQLWSWLILATTGVEVEKAGLERLDANRTYIFAANHQSIYDIPVIFASLPFQLRIIAKESLGRFPFLGWHLRRAGHRLVDRKRPDRVGILEWAASLPGKGASLIVFPEGTRSPDGRVGPFKAGAFLLALQAGLPIVPVSVVGSRHVMTKGHLTTRPGRVRLIVHEPVETVMTANPATSEVRALAARVREVIRGPVEAEVNAGGENLAAAGTPRTSGAGA